MVDEPYDPNRDEPPASPPMNPTPSSAGPPPSPGPERSGAPASPARPSDKDDRTMALVAHLTGLTWCIGVPGFIGPLVVWLVKKDSSAFVDRHAKEALNFHLTALIYFAISWLLVLVIIGFLLVAAVYILVIVVAIMAAMAANEGRDYRYPLSIRFIK